MHSIRLLGPWQLKVVAVFAERADGGYDVRTSDLPPGAKATMPADWADAFGPHFLGRVRYRRTFQKPTGLDGARVWLVVEPPRSSGTVNLNDISLGTVRCGDALGRFEVTDILSDRNTLEVNVSHPMVDAAGQPTDDGSTELPGGLVGEVRLEIEE